MRLTALSWLLMASLPAVAMQIDWVRMTGRWPLEAAPLVADVNGDGETDVLGVNRGGELLLWRVDGTPRGSGPDGVAAKLPEGKWTSSPTFVDTPAGPLIICCSVEGLVVALSRDLQERWRYQLPGQTAWAKATPALVPTVTGPMMCFLDQSGTLTALKNDGTVAWSVKSEDGTAGPSALATGTKATGNVVLAPLGSRLVCVTVEGRTLWSTSVEGAKIKALSMPAGPSESLRVAVTAEGGIVATIDLRDGAVAWQTKLPGELDNAPLYNDTRAEGPLLALTGLWGDLYALTPDGQRAWTHVFPSKNRGAPLLFDANGDGQADFVQATYAQHVLAFDGGGRLVDDLRVNGLANPSLVQCADSSGQPGFLVTTASLLLYRAKPGPAASPYGAQKVAPENVTLTPTGEAVLVENPRGSLISVEAVSETSGRVINGGLTSRSHYELPLPAPGHYHAVVSTPDGRTLAETDVDVAPEYRRTHPQPGLFIEADAIAVDPLYIGEAGDGTATLGISAEKPVRVRVTLDAPKREDGAVFAGKVALHETVAVQAINGEEVEDALNPLGPAGVLLIEPGKASTVWAIVDAHNAEPGHYAGRVVVTPLENVKPIEVPLNIEVLPLNMPDKFPLRLCTWDYVPNKWFPDHTSEVLDDMGRHGVDLFPRNALPEARADNAGSLQMNWAKLDGELERLKGRGQILFHIGHPAVTFTSPPSDAAKRKAEVEFLRAFRDHLKQRGLVYGDYAFYPVDEPGLDYQDANVDALVDTATLFREADPQLRVYTDPVPSLSWQNFERIEPLIDVWCPNMRQVSGLLAGDPRIRRIMDSGKPVWSYECVGQVKSLSPLRYNRANAWRAWYFGLDGIGFWTHSQTQEDMWYPSKDEYALVYPGEDPVPSARWEAVRDGMEDVAAMAMLESEIARNKGAGTKADVVARAEDELRIAKNDIVELSDAAFVESRDYLREGDRRIWHTPADVETYSRHRGAIAELTLALQGE